MNTERLHSIAIEVKTDIEQLKIVNLLQQLATHLQNVVNQPQQPTHQENLAKIRELLFSNLEKSKVNDFSPAWIQALEEIRLNDYLGVKLSNKIKDIFRKNHITPQVALQEIQKLHAKESEILSNLTHLINSFSYLGISKETLEAGEGEVGILLPREYLDNRFDKLAQEFKELNGILSIISEVGTGEIEYFELRQLSTTDPLVTLGASIATLSTIAIAIKKIVSAYKEIVEIRILHAKLADMKVKSTRLKGIEDHAEEIMEKTIEEIKNELMKKSPITDKCRKNELSNGLSIVLRKLANRVDRGFNIEVRVAQVEIDDTDEDNNDKVLHIKVIQNAMKEMKFMNVDGEPILHLPESNNKHEC